MSPLIILLLLQPLPEERNQKICGSFNDGFKLRHLTTTISLMSDKRLLLLIPIITFIGMEQGFFSSDFTQVRNQLLASTVFGECILCINKPTIWMTCHLLYYCNIFY